MSIINYGLKTNTGKVGVDKLCMGDVNLGLYKERYGTQPIFLTCDWQYLIRHWFEPFKMFRHPSDFAVLEVDIKPSDDVRMELYSEPDPFRIGYDRSFVCFNDIEPDRIKLHRWSARI